MNSDSRKKSFFVHSISSNGNITINPTTIASSTSISRPFRGESGEISTLNSVYDVDNGNVKPSTSSMTAFKRWNSVPMGINFNYCIRCPEPSPSSSSSSDEEEDTSSDPNSSETIPTLTAIGRKSASLCAYNRRPSSASSAAYAIRHRSSSSALFLPTLPFRLLDRGIEKLKREANIPNCIKTDYAGEKMSITGAAIMYSMDEFNIAEGNSTDMAIGNSEQRRRTQSLTEPVHVLTNLLPASCSPSPTRIEKQCYSPSMQQVVRSIAMSPTSSPSPTRRQCIRSLSPIALRTGMGLKRKCTGDSDAEGSAGLPAKRAHYSVPTTPPVIAIENSRPPVLYSLPAQSLNHSLSESSIDSECSISTISSDFTNISNAIFHQNRSFSNNVSTAASVSSNFPGSSSIEEFPIIEESSIDEDIQDAV